ncbi:MAG: hypothetical protein ABIR16_07455 [Dokdonella sp.]
MKTELFLMRSLFVLAAIASITAMGGMLRSDVVVGQKLAQSHAVATHAG